MTEKNLKLSEVVDYINELENRLDNLIDYADDLEDKLYNAEEIIDYIDKIITKTGSLEEVEWGKIKKKYKNIEIINSAIRTLNTIVDELWCDEDTVSNQIEEICCKSIGEFQNCLNLLLDEKTI